jgi:TRAP-type C4-dicarboxylate transport system permease small subunit
MQKRGENHMKKCWKVVNKAFDIIEIYLPMIAFFMVFVLYIAQIIMRYGAFGKTGKLFELCQIMFVWCSILSASYPGRAGSHIQFTILYDKCGAGTQLAFRLIGDLMVIVAFCIIFPYACREIDFLTIKKSDLLRIRFNIIYAPFLSFVALTTIHCLRNLVKDSREMLERLQGRKCKEAERQM